MILPKYSDVEYAHERIKNWVHRTPVLTSQSINSLFSANIFFKCENFQKAGAFKFRGASNAVLQLNENEAKNGVATHSSGNHAAALSLAAKKRGIEAYVVMPQNAPLIKKKAVKSYGAQIFYCEPGLQAREQTLAELIKKYGAIEIHPYNNFNVIAGQGTAAKEFIEDWGSFDLLLCPVGGGGLLAGTALTTKALLPSTKVIACEPARADDAFRSYYAGKIYPSDNPQTLADGLLTSLGKINFAIMQKYVDGVVTVSEQSIVEAMQIIWERMKIVVEPSSAVPLAAIIEKKIDVQNKKTGIILSGGNVDLNSLSNYFK